MSDPPQSDFTTERTTMNRHPSHTPHEAREALLARAAAVEATWPRDRPADWKPDLRAVGDREEWHPPPGSKCSPMAYVRTGEPSRDARSLEALRESAWQALEIERITGEPPLKAADPDA